MKHDDLLRMEYVRAVQTSTRLSQERMRLERELQRVQAENKALAEKVSPEEYQWAVEDAKAKFDQPTASLRPWGGRERGQRVFDPPAACVRVFGFSESDRAPLGVSHFFAGRIRSVLGDDASCHEVSRVADGSSVILGVDRSGAADTLINIINVQKNFDSIRFPRLQAEQAESSQ
eukprot:TRINITY_DN2016_c0_g1_i1.p1 TRINITY_DN2016_c0_g1~~TRINITY_DN2016_c0_g1_i1.p1  ORF type:complete len:175 (+),score=21.32 TRINITY_DN2016_c0_g1_i1:135-659(+)